MENTAKVAKVKKVAIPALAIVLAAVVITIVVRLSSHHGESVIRISGNIEVTDTEVSFKIPGRVEARLVAEGEMVKAGQIVARLDRAELEHEDALRRAEVRAAEAVLAELEAGSRPEEITQADANARRSQARHEELLAGSRPEEVAAAEAAFERAKADAQRLAVDFERYKGLYAKQLVSAQQFDAARTAHEVAKARAREAEENLKLVKEGPRREQLEQTRAAMLQDQARLALVKEGPRKETIAQARARLEQARQALAVAETRLGYVTLVSPLSGVVLSENVEAGEFVAAGTPVVTVGDLAHAWLRAYINETDLGRVKVGQRVRVTTDTYPDKFYEGRISFIASQAEFTPKSVQTAKERVKLVYRIKVEVTNPNMELKPGMPADAEILLTSPEGGK